MARAEQEGDVPGSVGSFEVRIPCEPLGDAGLAFRVFYPGLIEDNGSKYKSPGPVPGTTFKAQLKYAQAAFECLDLPRFAALPAVIAGSLGFIDRPAPLAREGTAGLTPVNRAGPPVIFAHGLSGSMNAYMRYASTIASRMGCIVFALEFADGSAAATLRHDGVWMDFERQTAPPEELGDYRNNQAITKAKEITQLIELVEKWGQGVEEPPESLTPLCHLMSLNEGVDVIGHSMGCPPALISAANSDKTRKVILLDPWWLTIRKEHWQASNVPVMIWLNGLWQWKSNLRRIKEIVDQMREKKVSISVITAERTHHGDQADFCFILPFDFRKPKNGKEPIELAEAMEYSIGSSEAFLRNRLGEYFKEQREGMDGAGVRLAEGLDLEE